MRLTKSELSKVITAIKVQCPEAINYKDLNEFDIVVNMWFDCFKDYSKELVWQATRQALTNSEYQKLNWLGVINKEIEKILSVGEKTESDLWAELNGILYEVSERAYYMRYDDHKEKSVKLIAEIFDNLSAEIKEYLSNTSVLVDIAKLDDEQLQYEKGRFIRAMPSLRKRVKYKTEFAQLGGEKKLLLKENDRNEW